MTDFPIHIAEEHSATLAIWWQHRASPKTAVYIDAHLDLQQISDAHIHQLKQCEHRDQLNALEAPHHLNQSDQYAYGIENFLHAAHELKLIDRLIWVVPPHIPRNYSQELLAYIQQMDGIGFEEMMRFQPVGENALRGTLLGLDITLCDYSALEHLALEQDYYLDIDIDYFVKVPEDQLWVDPAIVIQSIIKQLGPPTLASISLAVSSGFTPLSLRFIGDYIESILKQDTSEYQHFQQLINLHTSLAQNQYDQAVSLGQQLIESKPNCAASHFMLSKALSASNAPVEQTKIAQQRAAELDSAYIYNLSSEACGFPNRFKPLSINQLNTLVSRLNELDPADSQYTHIAVAQLLATHQHLNPAWQIAQNLSPNMQHHPGVNAKYRPKLNQHQSTSSRATVA